MATHHYNSSSPSPIFILFISIAILAVVADSDEDFSPTPQKKTHLHFYMHDILTGPNVTAVNVTKSPVNATFGTIVIIDDQLTHGPNITSKPIGRAQGLYAYASLEGIKFLWTMNFAFGEGKYKGSTLALLGTDDISASTREIPVVGGTGRFRLARGYILVKTYFFDPVTGNAVLEIDAHVHHA